ncbi:hypothetical protein J4433_02980 [Candidatus Pacearchaeota archaeon]|nr:hypothetical protein [Candidatus Pacearchaeota archaeon]
MWNKNAQAAAAIIIVAVLLLGYLILMPPKDKCQIFPDSQSCKNATEIEGKTLLLSETPGLLQPIEESAEYKISAIDLFNRENTEVPVKLDAEAVIEKSWFNSKTIEEEFIVPGRAIKVTLFLGISEASELAALSVILNGKIITRVVGPGVHVIDLPESKIKHTNTLKLAASIPLLPGNLNKFRIGSLMLKQRYSLTQPEIGRSFVIEQDSNDISSAELKFDADCYSSDALQVQLNDKPVLNEKICTGFTGSVKGMLAKDNEITFSSDGNYFIDNIRLKVKFKQRDYTTYYFAIDKDNYDKISEGKVLAMLALRFPDTEHKEITIYVNGNPVNIDTEKVDYKTSISRLLLKGQNSIKVVPDTKVSIGKIEVNLE